MKELELEFGLLLLAQANAPLMDQLVKTIREQMLLECFFPLDLPKLNKSFNYDADTEAATAPSTQNESDSYTYMCHYCNEATVFSNADMITDARYREICLTDICIERELELFIADRLLN